MKPVNKPLFSIVTPTFNMSRFLKDCIISVQNQDYPFVEHIIQDGKSTDNTIDILKRYSKKKLKHALHWISEPDTGQNDGLNKAIQRIKGDFFLVLNADDILLPYACTWAATHFQIFPEIAVIYGDQYIINEQGDIIKIASGKNYDITKLFCLELVPPAQAAFIRRSMFEKVGLYADTTLDTCPDFEMWVRIGLKFRMKHIPGIISKYRSYPHDDSRGRRSPQRFYQAKKTVIDRTLSAPETPPEIKQLKNRAYSGLSFWIGREVAYSEYPQYPTEGINYLMHSFLYHPNFFTAKRLLTNAPQIQINYSLLHAVTLSIVQSLLHSIPYSVRCWWNNLFAYQRARVFAQKITQSPVFSKLTFHPNAGKIVKNKQYFFNGSVTTYPHVQDNFMHYLFKLTKGAPEPEEIFLFLQIIQKLPQNAVIVELGAGNAFYSIIAAKKFKKSQIFLVEANPHFIEILKNNMKLNNLTNRSTIIHAAISNTSNEQVFIKEADYGSSINRSGEYSVSTLSVDDFINRFNINHVNVIHMDVQGAEENVLHGMKQTLLVKQVDYIFIATHKHYRHLACQKYLDSFGYRTIFSKDPDTSASFDGILICTNLDKTPKLSL